MTAEEQCKQSPNNRVNTGLDRNKRWSVRLRAWTGRVVISDIVQLHGSFKDSSPIKVANKRKGLRTTDLTLFFTRVHFLPFWDKGYNVQQYNNRLKFFHIQFLLSWHFIFLPCLLNFKCVTTGPHRNIISSLLCPACCSVAEWWICIEKATGLDPTLAGCASKGATSRNTSRHITSA